MCTCRADFCVLARPAARYFRVSRAAKKKQSTGQRGSASYASRPCSAMYAPFSAGVISERHFAGALLPAFGGLALAGTTVSAFPSGVAAHAWTASARGGRQRPVLHRPTRVCAPTGARGQQPGRAAQCQLWPVQSLSCRPMISISAAASLALRSEISSLMASSIDWCREF